MEKNVLYSVLAAYCYLDIALTTHFLGWDRWVTTVWLLALWVDAGLCLHSPELSLRQTCCHGWGFFIGMRRCLWSSTKHFSTTVTLLYLPGNETEWETVSWFIYQPHSKRVCFFQSVSVLLFGDAWSRKETMLWESCPSSSYCVHCYREGIHHGTVFGVSISFFKRYKIPDNRFLSLQQGNASPHPTSPPASRGSLDTNSAVNPPLKPWPFSCAAFSALSCALGVLWFHF